MNDDEKIRDLTRKPARYVFYVDVSKVDPTEAEGYLRKVKERFKQRPEDGEKD